MYTWKSPCDRLPGYFVDSLNFASDFAPDQLSDSGKFASFQNGAPNTLCALFSLEISTLRRAFSRRRGHRRALLALGACEREIFINQLLSLLSLACACACAALARPGCHLARRSASQSGHGHKEHLNLNCGHSPPPLGALGVQSVTSHPGPAPQFILRNNARKHEPKRNRIVECRARRPTLATSRA